MRETTNTTNAGPTPGTWEARIAPDDDKGRNACVVARLPDGRTVNVASLFWTENSGSRASDARLIASAPDLLAALRDLVDVAEGYERTDTEAAEESGEAPYIAPRLKAARAAIARAEGKGGAR